MRYNPKKIVTILLFAVLATLVLVSAVPASEPAASLMPPANATASNVSRMEVGVFVNSIDNLDFVKGTYSMDFYLHFRWTDPTIQTAHFEIMNGQPSNEPHSLEKLSESKSGPVKEEWYRVRADFSITPNIRDYPFESGITPIEIEDAEYNKEQLVYVPMVNESGIDTGFVIPGWNIGTPTFVVFDHTYPWGKTYTELSFGIPITKNATDSLIQTIIPPLIFCLIAMLSFFIKVEHNELVHLRYVLTTSMFISAVMYHFSQLSLLPGLGVLKLFDKFMIAVYVFLAVTIAVTTLCYLAQQQWGKPELVSPINRYGLVLSIILPVVMFWVLLVRV
jgi:hypothetical protein